MKLKLNQTDSDHLNVYGYTIVSDQDAPPLIILTLDGLQDFADHFCAPCAIMQLTWFCQLAHIDCCVCVNSCELLASTSSW